MAQSDGLIGKMVITCARILGQLTYTPAYYKNGKLTNQKVELPVRVNFQDGARNKKQMDFRITAWGPLADMFARFANPGKSFDFSLGLTQYMKKIFNRPNEDGSPGGLRLDQAGQPIEVKMFGFQVDDFAFGDDSAKWIAEQIALNMLPTDWNKPGTAGKVEFDRIQALKGRVIWDGQSTNFMNARVSIPSGVQLVNPAEVMSKNIKEPIFESQFRSLAWPHLAGQSAQTSVQNTAPQVPAYGNQALPQDVGRVLNSQGQPAQQQAPVYANVPTAPQTPVYVNAQGQPAQQGAHIQTPASAGAAVYQGI